MKRLDQLRVAGMLLTRLPMGRVARVVPMGETAWAWPLIGALVGAIVAAVAWGAGELPPLVTGVLAVAAGLLATGAMHEDGLADCADGFGGGRDRARKLEIMRDSRLGSYGAAALCLALLAKVALIGALDDTLLLIATGAASRALLPALQQLVPQARAEGLGAGAAAVGRGGAAVAAGLGCGALVICPDGPAAVLALAVVQAGVALISRRQIGGITGDVLGAAQLLGEIAALIIITR